MKQKSSANTLKKGSPGVRYTKMGSTSSHAEKYPKRAESKSKCQKVVRKSIGLYISVIMRWWMSGFVILISSFTAPASKLMLFTTRRNNKSSPKTSKMRRKLLVSMKTKNLSKNKKRNRLIPTMINIENRIKIYFMNLKELIKDWLQILTDLQCRKAT